MSLIVCKICESNKNKSKWGPGVWQGELDRLEYDYLGYFCLIHRGPVGSLCGYVGIDKTHPYYSIGYDDVYEQESTHNIPEDKRVECHGGLTYSGAYPCKNSLNPTVNDLHFFGFDCAHYDDVSPGFPSLSLKQATYRDTYYVNKSIEGIVRGLAYVNKFIQKASKRKLVI